MASTPSSTALSRSTRPCRTAAFVAALLAGMCIFAGAASAKTYYVSPTGSDANAGTTQTAPWRSIDKVSSTAFKGGDVVLLEGGQTFAGRLAFDSLDAATQAAPIIVASYGTGRATIDGGNGSALSIYNGAGYKIHHLDLVGSGPATNTGSGVEVYADLPGDVKLGGITIDRIDVAGFGKMGVSIGTWNGRTGFRDVRVTRVNAHDNGQAGIATFSQAYPAHDRVYVGRSKAYLNRGVPTMTKNSGSGIVLGGVSNSIVEYSLAHDNGERCVASECGAGIWAYDSTTVTIQRNESYRNRTGGGSDGDGFDLDVNVSDSILQYNYSHDNDGHGYLVCQAPGSTEHRNNTIRYNVSENDSRRLPGGGAVMLYGNVVSDQFYNNTIFMSPNAANRSSAVVATGRPNDLRTGQSFFRNNVFFTTGTSAFVENRQAQSPATANLVFENNDYFNTEGAFMVRWGTTAYTGLAAWRSSTGAEKLGSTNTGFTVDPKLSNPGKGGTVGDPDKLRWLSAYRLRSTSPLVNKGLRVADFGIAPGAVDYHRDPLPSGAAYDIGASEVQLPVFTLAGSATASVPAGGLVDLTSEFKSTTTTTALVDVEVWSTTGRVFQSYADKVPFTANTPRVVSNVWNTAGVPPGTYWVYHGVWTPGWAQLLRWEEVATIDVR